MSDNMDLITKITQARHTIKGLTKRKNDAESTYKESCNKLGYKPPSKEELESEDPLSGDSRLRSIQGRSEDDETLLGLRNEADARRRHIEMLKSNIDDARQEQIQLEQILQSL
mmetsp:Transcript_13311/g.18152  ORF Transcript_13311/g.18152 Transcript_13311/m.18152 type:complete len:113 (+) Transcript_13311:490-828(+)